MDFGLSEEQVELQRMARRLAVGEFAQTAARSDREERFPWENKARLAELGLLGLSLPTTFGGGGGSLVDLYVVVEEIAKVDMTTALILHDQNVSARVIALHGSDAQKARLLPGLGSGEMLCSIAMTEPDAGSDLTALSTRVLGDGDKMFVRGQKVFTSFGDVATHHLVYARFGESEGARGIGTVLVRADSPGVCTQRLESKMGARGIQECQIFFDDVSIEAADVVIAGDPMSTTSFRRALSVYNGTRVGLGVIAVGVAQGAFELARDHLVGRRQFGRALAEFQGLQWMLADMAIAIEASRLLCYRALTQVDNGEADPFYTSIAKVHAVEMAQRVVYDALQLAGGYGYFSSMPLERMARDVRMLPLAGGTTQVLKNTIAKAVLAGTPAPSRVASSVVKCREIRSAK